MEPSAVSVRLEPDSAFAGFLLLICMPLARLLRTGYFETSETLHAEKVFWILQERLTVRFAALERVGGLLEGDPGPPWEVVADDAGQVSPRRL